MGHAARFASGFRLLVLVCRAVSPALLFGAAAARAGTWTETNVARAPSPRERATAVWTGNRMIVWGGSDVSGPVQTGGIYDPVADVWTATDTTNAPSGRTGHTAVWTGSKMIVWGGNTVFGPRNTGGLYDPVADTWTLTSIVGAPAPRHGHTAVWTGSRMIVWGGWGASYLTDGGIFDPATNSWAPMSTKDAPIGYYHVALWTGSKMIVWGPAGGGVYDPQSDVWTPMTPAGAPECAGATAVWTGSKMIVWGGQLEPSVQPPYCGAAYDPAADAWSPTSRLNDPGGRYDHTAVWTGTRMFVWGGLWWPTPGFPNGMQFFDSGGIYDPVSDSWASVDATAPAGRYFHSAVWAGSKMIVWGGLVATDDNLSAESNTGGIYDLNPRPATAFIPLTPCRVVDTRTFTIYPDGYPIPGLATWPFLVSGTCGVPAWAEAISVNVVAVDPTADGFLTVYAGDAPQPPPTSTVNFARGRTRSNNAFVPLGKAGTIRVKNASTGAVHFVLDVNGYFVAPAVP